jgi:hypothetical protein
MEINLTYFVNNREVYVVLLRSFRRHTPPPGVIMSYVLQRSGSSHELLRQTDLAHSQQVHVYFHLRQNNCVVPSYDLR